MSCQTFNGRGNYKILPLCHDGNNHGYRYGTPGAIGLLEICLRIWYTMPVEPKLKNNFFVYDTHVSEYIRQINLAVLIFFLLKLVRLYTKQ